MSGVRFSGPFNSTTFTTCCDTAIMGEECCPRCDKPVYPYYEDSAKGTKDARFRHASSALDAMAWRRKR